MDENACSILCIFLCRVCVGRGRWGGWRADLIHTHFHAQVSMISRFLVNLKLLLSVDYDYLLLDYYYGVVWRASWRKRVQQDYDYLDYFVSASRSEPILTSMCPSGREKLNQKAGFSDDLRLFLCRLPRRFLVLLGEQMVRKTSVSLEKRCLLQFPCSRICVTFSCVRLFLFRFPSGA